MDRDQTVGCALVCFFAVGGLAGGWFLRELPISFDEGMNFFGGAFGGAIAVVGAVLALEWDRMRRAQENQRVIVGLAEDAAEWLEKVQNPTEAEDLASAQMRNIRTFAAAVERLKIARAWFPPQTIGMAKAYTTIEAIIVDTAALEKAVTPSLFYNSKADLSQKLALNDALLKQVIAEMHIHTQAIRSKF